MPRTFPVSAAIRFATVPELEHSYSHARPKWEKKSPSLDRQNCISTYHREKEMLFTLSQSSEIAIEEANSLPSKLNQVFYEMTVKSIIPH